MSWEANNKDEEPYGVDSTQYYGTYMIQSSVVT